MTNPIFDEVSKTFELMKKTARIEARIEIADDLRKIPKPTKQVVDIIKKLESNENNNQAK
jgi:hypothetical protein